MDPVTATLIVGGASSATDIAGSFISGFQGRKSAKRAAKYARWNSAWAAQNLPGLQMEGLRAAGLNPILAAGRFGGAVSPGTGTPASIGQSSGVDFSRVYSNVSSAKLAREQRETQEQMTDYYRHLAKKTKEEARTSKSQAALDESYSDNVSKSTTMQVLDWLRRLGLTPHSSFNARPNTILKPNR